MPASRTRFPHVARSVLLAILWLLSASHFTPVKAQQLDLVVQKGHTQEVSDVVFSPDGKTFASGSNDDSIKLWSVDGGREIKTLIGHTAWVWRLAFSPKGKILASGSIDKTIKLWNVETGHEIRTLTGHTESVRAVAFSPNGKILASGSADKTVKLWDVDSGELINTLVSHTHSVHAVAFSPDGKTLASGSFDNTIKLWDVNLGIETKSLTGHADSVLSVAFSPDGKTLASGSTDRTIKFWNLDSKREIDSFQAHDGSVYSVVFSPEGETLVSGGGDNKIILWNVESKHPIMSFGGHKQLVHSVKFSRDGQVLASGSFDSSVRLWNVATGQQIKSIDERAIVVNSVAFSPDGKTLASGTDDNTIRLWSLNSGQQTRALDGHTSLVTAVAFSPDGKTLASASFDKTVRLWNVETGRQIKLRTGGDAWVRQHLSWVRSVAFSPDGKTLASGGDDADIKLWDVETGTLIKPLANKVGSVLSIAFSPDRKSLAYAGGDSAVRLLNLESGKELRSFTHSGNQDVHNNSIAFSPNGEILASGSSRNTISLWHVKSEKKTTLEGHTEEVVSVGFSPDGKTLASGSYDKTIKLWDVDSEREVKTFAGHAKSVSSIAFSLDGRFLASGSSDATIKLWDRRNDGLLTTLISLDKDEWVVATPEGRFDTNKSLERVAGLHWVIHSEIIEALPLDIFMRPYYEPRLLPRLLAHDEFREAPRLESINRVQPKVTITEVKKDGPATATVTVEVENVKRNYPREKNPLVESGAKDLRLFRDGQLVSYRDGDLLGQQQEATSGCEPVASDIKKCRAVFQQLRLPQQANVNDVEFSAYAFNSSDVKSETSRVPLKFKRDLSPRKGRVYLITVGLSSYENSAWDLKFAANDAHLIDDTVAAKLRATGDYDEVVNVSLTSEEKVVNGRKLWTKSATKENFRKIMRLLAGAKLSAKETKDIPNARKIQQATPEDVVLIFYSSHGYRDEQRFYLFPYNTGAGPGRDPETVVPHSISSDDLYLWLRDVDAGDLVLVIDACHAAAVTGSEFKPGPMGSRGLGQLAYDKGMRILAATQPDTTAAEVDQIEGRKIQHGLLTYALVENGLIEGLADTDRDGVIMLSEWLAHGVSGVPTLFEQALRGESASLNSLTGRLTAGGTSRVSFISRGEGDKLTQQPSLFDFTDKVRRRRPLPISRTRRLN